MLRPILPPVSVIARLCAATALHAAAAEPPPFTGPANAGGLEAPPRHEASGLAASRRNPGLLWTHDDGGPATLFAITGAGKKVGALQLRGVKNDDWEDLAAGELDGQPVLLIAATGDNDARRPHAELHLVAEPALAELQAGAELRVRPLRTIRFRYEDGPHDCEAVALDGPGRAAWLLTKRDQPPQLFRVPLDSADAGVVVARRQGVVPNLPQPSAAQRAAKGHLGRRRAEVTALDFAPDGSAALVLTYGDLQVFPRRADEAWSAALARPPVRLREPALPQAEAACFAADGRQIFVASETSRALLRYDRR